MGKQKAESRNWKAESGGRRGNRIGWSRTTDGFIIDEVLYRLSYDPGMLNS